MKKIFFLGFFTLFAFELGIIKKNYAAGGGKKKVKK